MLENMSAQMDALKAEQEKESGQIDVLEKKAAVAFSKVAIVHYDAFPNISGKLSFSVAMLNEGKNGYILSNIHGREDARCYLKPVVNGQAQTVLSEEEKSVLETALVQ